MPAPQKPFKKPSSKRKPAEFNWDYGHLAGPFDVFGDVHGCIDELETLLSRLGYDQTAESWRHPYGRIAVFVGDLCDRGPGSLLCIELVRAMVQSGQALMTLGNHDEKFARWLEGNKVKIAYGLDQTITEYQESSGELKQETLKFIKDMPLYLKLDGGRLLVAHAGVEPDMIGWHSSRIRAYCLFGPVEGFEANDLPIRYDWAPDHDGSCSIIYGHTPVKTCGWRNKTLNLDTGCVFGGVLSALRYPEMELVSEPSRKTYYPARKWVSYPDLALHPHFTKPGHS